MEKVVRKSKPRVDITNKEFTYLTPKYYIKGGKWHCVCKCGNELDVETRNLNSGHTKSCGCLQKEKASKNTKSMLGYEDDNIKVLNYAGSDNQQIAKWNCICKHCGRTFVTRGSTIRNGCTKSCGCINSANEQAIIKLLSDNNIEFSCQYTFPDLIGINGGKLRFDFAIYVNGSLSHLIEFNGIQHYERPAGSWASEYDALIVNDNKKIQYCKDNNIELRIIKYDEKYSIDDLI